MVNTAVLSVAGSHPCLNFFDRTAVPSQTFGSDDIGNSSSPYRCRHIWPLSKEPSVIQRNKNWLMYSIKYWFSTVPGTMMITDSHVMSLLSFVTDDHRLCCDECPRWCVGLAARLDCVGCDECPS